MLDDVFSPMQAEARRASRAAYRQYLIQRDGNVDVATRTMSHREARMQHYERPLTRIREIDRSLFYVQHENFKTKREMTAEAALLLALVTVNSAEVYGVEQSFDMVQRRAQLAEDDCELLLMIEECYHTRILLSSALLYGLTVKEPSAPPMFLRAIIANVKHAPEAVSRPLILASEVVAVVMFTRLLEATRHILAHDPELRDALEERIVEVLIDEIGHISFNRTLLGPAGMAYARALFPMVAEGTARMMPVLSRVGAQPTRAGGASVLTASRLPLAARSAAFVA